MSDNPFPGGQRLPHANHGRAGASLGTSVARGQFGKHADIGAVGEKRFAQALRDAGLDTAADIYYSLGLPRGHGRKQTQSDVDAVLANGNRVVLVDVKRWKGNVIYWTLGGLPFRGLEPLTHGGRWRLSANMAAALQRYREALPGVNVSAMVVFVPAPRGAAPASVRWMKWPGGIRSFLLPAALRELHARLGSTYTTPPARVSGLLKSLER